MIRRQRIALFLLLASFSILIPPHNLNAADLPDKNMLNLVTREHTNLTLSQTADRIDIGTKGIVSLFMKDKKTLTIKGLKPGFSMLMIRYADGTMERFGVTVNAPSSKVIQNFVNQIKSHLNGVPGIAVQASGDKVLISGEVQPQYEPYYRQIVSMYSDIVLDLTGSAGAGEGRIIQVDVKVIELSLEYSKDLGIEWFADGAWEVDFKANASVDKTQTDAGSHSGSSSSGDSDNSSSDSGSDSSDSSSTSSSSASTGLLGSSFSTGSGSGGEDDSTHIKATGQIDVDNVNFKVIALAKEGKAKLLATPKLLVESGKKATFLVGGEVPIVSTTSDTSTVEYKPFGTHLNIAPIIKDNNEIFINVMASVSRLDFSRSVKGNPTILKKEATTNLTVRDGTTFAIAGLISEDEIDKVSKVPILGNIPILGYLFKSKSKSTVQDETIIFLTPRIIQSPRHQTSFVSAPGIRPSKELEKELIHLKKEEKKDEAKEKKIEEKFIEEEKKPKKRRRFLFF